MPLFGIQLDTLISTHVLRKSSKCRWYSARRNIKSNLVLLFLKTRYIYVTDITDIEDTCVTRSTGYYV